MVCFYCVFVIVVFGKRIEIVEGMCEGYILEEKRGENGFGYDFIFFVEKWRCFMVELIKE